jgi:hypothetical protein
VFLSVNRLKSMSDSGAEVPSDKVMHGPSARDLGTEKR